MEKEKLPGEISITFKGRKPEDGDIIIREKRRNHKKGVTISGAAKMKAAYKARKARKNRV